MFSQDVNNLKKRSFFKKGVIPTTKEILFQAKVNELIERYDAARKMMELTVENEDGTISPRLVCENDENTLYSKYFYQSIYYETALLYYNMVVDLSWVISKVVLEFVYLQNTEKQEIRNMIEDFQEEKQCKQILNTIECFSEQPSQWVEYFARQDENLKPVCNLLASFWNTLTNNSCLRKRYNYIKHRGKPTYYEMNQITRIRDADYPIFIFADHPYTLDEIMSNNKPKPTLTLPSSGESLRKEYHLIESIDDLKNFDETTLYPYIETLLMELEKVLLS